MKIDNQGLLVILPKLFISNVLDAGLRTKDIATKGSKVISTVEMGDAVISSLNDLS